MVAKPVSRRALSANKTGIQPHTMNETTNTAVSNPVQSAPGIHAIIRGMRTPSTQRMGIRMRSSARPKPGRRPSARTTCIRVVVRDGLRPLDQEVDLGRLEAGDLDFEVELDFGQVLELDREQGLVPAGKLREAIVGDDIGPLLIFGQMIDKKGRDRVQPQDLRGLDPAVTGDDHVFGINQHRVRKSKLPDAGCDLTDLLFRVRSGVACVWLQLFGLAPNNG